MTAPAGEASPAGDYLRQVVAEIDEEVRRRRGEIPVRLERELDELFFEHAPIAGRGRDLGDALRMVDQAAFIDPVVPVASRRPAGAVVKKGLRSVQLWYVGYVTHQVSKFGAAVSRALHAVDAQLEDLRERVPPASATHVLDTGSPGAWWAPRVVEALRGTKERALHAACGDGWLVRMLVEAGVDAYGVDPRQGAVAEAELGGADLRQEGPVEHLRAVERSALGAIVLSGVVEGIDPARRDELVHSAGERIGSHGVLVVHSMSPAAWAAEDAPPEADLAPGKPLRPGTWVHLLQTWTVQVVEAPDGADYLVVATR